MIFYSISLMIVLVSVERMTDGSVENINRQNLTWKAGRNLDKSIDLNGVWTLLGNLPDSRGTGKFSSYSNDKTEFPKTFEAPKPRLNCASVIQIRDKENCESYWVAQNQTDWNNLMQVSLWNLSNFTGKLDEMLGCNSYYKPVFSQESYVPYRDCSSSLDESPNYKSGGSIRKPVENQVIEVIGTVEDNTANKSEPHWLIANLWNRLFGENGFFKILHSKTHGGFGSNIAGVIPTLSPSSGETSGHDFQRFALSLLTTLICFICCR